MPSATTTASPKTLETQKRLRNEGKCGAVFGKGNKSVCTLDKSHDGSHKRTYARKQWSPLPEGFTLAGAEDVPETEVFHVTEQKRDEYQQKFDADVKAAHDAWVAAGKPSDFNKSPRTRYLVNPGEEERYLDWLDKAATLHDVNVKVAKPLPRHTSGKLMVVYVAKDRQVRAAKSNGTGSQTPDATADQES